MTGDRCDDRPSQGTVLRPGDRDVCGRSCPASSAIPVWGIRTAWCTVQHSKTQTGLGAGLATSLLLGRFLAALLYGVPTWDPPVLLGVTVLLALVALASGLVPALRAARPDPMVALRAE